MISSEYIIELDGITVVEKKTDASKNIPYISFLSVLSAVGVVYMHLCGFHGMTPALSVQWVMSMCIEKIFVFAVPVFFMITGATLIDYPQKYDDWTYLKKRVCRTVAVVNKNWTRSLRKCT